MLEVQLVGGSVPNEGRLKVYLNGAWATVNGDGFDMTDANVVCRSLGYGDARNYVTTPDFGRGTGSILMDEVGCQGTEDSIFDCTYNLQHESSDTHDNDVGITCRGRGRGRVHFVLPTTLHPHITLSVKRNFITHSSERCSLEFTTSKLIIYGH